MVSLNSGNMLAQGGEDGMPDRVRIYKGGDRPYFEDVSGGGESEGRGFGSRTSTL